jgi:hypothetical protein
MGVEINDRRRLQDGIMELLEKYAVVAFAGKKSNRRTKSWNSLSPTFTSGRALMPRLRKTGDNRDANRAARRSKPSLRRSALQLYSRRRAQSVFDPMG